MRGIIIGLIIEGITCLCIFLLAIWVFAG